MIISIKDNELKIKIIDYREKQKKKKKKKRIDKWNKPREVPKGLNNSIQKTRFFYKRGSSNLSVDKI